ncbi:MAG: apolipoprotein N-acyltransferase [Desulfobulbus sp.]|nr:MAG: apolipoprotein N-acyltransferase [Desulfobulbus sp.]
MNISRPRPRIPRLFSSAVAACSALLLFLGMPGIFGWWPLLFIALVPLLLMVAKLAPRRAACMGMFCGLLYSISLIYWIVIVLGRYGGLPIWISVAGMAMLALYMAAYFAFFCLLLSVFAARSGMRASGRLSGFLLAAPVLWVGLDYLRGFLFSGFPWMDLGYGLYRQPMLIQAADLAGHHLITFALVLVNTLIACVIAGRSGERRVNNGGWLFVASCVFLLVLCGYSFERYQHYRTIIPLAEQAVVSVAQGNIAQDEKWTPAKKQETVATYLALSEKIVHENRTDLIIWPETALPFFPGYDVLMGRVLDFVRAEKVTLLTGAPSVEIHVQEGKRKVDTFNSAVLISAEGRLAGRYDKQHLVPFGEYVPLRSYLPFLEPLVVSVGDFTPGSSFESLQAGRIKAGVLICFEAIFPDIARQEVSEGSNLLVNITNDAWYGRTSAPYQSFAMAAFRAVENRRSLVRAANTGLSGFVDPVGKIHLLSPLFHKAAITSPVALLEKKTFFTIAGHGFGAFCLFSILPILLVCRKK